MLDAAPDAIPEAQAQRLQLVGYVSSAVSLIGVSYVLLLLLHQQWRACGANKASGRRGRAQMDFSRKLVLVLALFDLASIVARVAGRAPVDNAPLCNLQAAVVQAANLASCSWVCCIAFNLYRWLVVGESAAVRQARFRLYLAVATVPSIAIVAYHLSADKYGDATFYCWLREIQLMFLTFYVFYVAMVVFNFVLLVLIHVNMKQRVARHDTIEADTSSMLIRRKLLLYLVVFIVHRSPMMIYRLTEAVGTHHVDFGLLAQVLQDLNGLSNSIVYGGLCRKQTPEDASTYAERLDEVESVSSPTESQQRPPYVAPKKKRGLVPTEDEGRDSIVLRSASTGSFRLTSTDSAAGVAAAITSMSFSGPSTALNKLEEGSSGPSGAASSSRSSTPDIGDFTTSGPTDWPLYPIPLYLQVHKRQQPPVLPDAQQQQLMGYKQRWKNHFAKVKGVAEATQAAAAAAVVPPRNPPIPPPVKVSIFTSTFNMGEKDANEAQLASWIPMGHDVYVIGVQECMDLADLQSKVLQHLVVSSGTKYVHYSCEIGKRATALGYHGYIALTIFVRESAVISGRFKMPSRSSGGSKSAQEVFRGKSLLVFGRASNKGAVGMSFRYDDTSFAFVTCHLASDSSSSGKKKKQQRATGGGGRTRTRTDESMNTAVDGDADEDAMASSRFEPPANRHPPSKVHRRNQDAMEILQQLYLDEEDHGFGFPHLHHHSFILGDFNYRMTRQGATPLEMLHALAAVGSQDLRNRQLPSSDRVEPVYKPMEPSLRALLSSPPTSPAMLQLGSDQSPMSSASFHEFMTPRTDLRHSSSSLHSSVDIDFSHSSLHIAGSSEEAGSDDQEAVARSADRVAHELKTLLQDHDELYHLRLSNQVFFGFEERAIEFYPTFRRIRGQWLDNPRDLATFEANYSLAATHGGFRVPSYTDRILFASLDGMRGNLDCESYTSCEQVTTSDHKPVVATFRVTLPRVNASSQHFVTEDYPWNANSTGANPNILQSSRFARSIFAAAGRMRDVPGACELRLRIEFRSIRWVDAVDSAAFDRAEHVQFGFLFPLPAEDVFAQQRKLHEVAEHLTWGGDHLGAGASSGSSGGSSAFDEFASTVTPTSNFQSIRWNDFVERGLRYHTMAGATGSKHVAVLLRAPSSRGGRSLSKGTSVARLRGGGGGQGNSSHSSSISSITALSPTPSTPAGDTPGASLSSSSASTLSMSTTSTAVGASTSLDQLFGHGTFCVDASGAKREVVVPLTIGGRLLGRLQLRVALKMRQQRAKGA